MKMIWVLLFRIGHCHHFEILFLSRHILHKPRRKVTFTEADVKWWQNIVRRPVRLKSVREDDIFHHGGTVPKALPVKDKKMSVIQFQCSRTTRYPRQCNWFPSRLLVDVVRS